MDTLLIVDVGVATNSTRVLHLNCRRSSDSRSGK